MDKATRFGPLFFGLAIAALGAENLILSRSTEVLPVLPWLPPITPFAIALGAVFILAGLAFIVGTQMRLAAGALAIVLTIALLALQIPRAAAAPIDLGSAIVIEMLALIATAAMLIPGPTRTEARLRNGGRRLFALASIVFGTAHLLVPDIIAGLVPAWMPAHLFFAWFTGLAMIAAGVGIGLELAAPLASMLLALMFSIFVATVHIPRVFGSAHDPDEWSSAFICLAMVGASLICARISAGKTSTSPPQRQ